MADTRKSGGDGFTSPDRFIFPLIKTLATTHPYTAAILAAVAIVAGAPLFTGFTKWKPVRLIESKFGVPSGELTAPWPDKPIAPIARIEGVVWGLPPERNLFLVIENSAGQLCAYQLAVVGDRFSRPDQEIGLKEQDVGRIYKLRLFVPSNGVRMSDGLYTSLPPGKYVSDAVTYIRM